MAYDLAATSALLLALGVLQGFNTRLPREYPQLAQAFTGLLFGFTSIASLILPFPVNDGFPREMYSVILGLAGLYGGLWPGVIAGVINAAGHFYSGEGNTLSHLLLISLSVSFGVGFRAQILRRHWRQAIGTLLIFGLTIGFLASAFYLLTLLTTGASIQPKQVLDFTLWQTTATVLLGLILHTHEDREKTHDALVASQARLEAIHSATPDATFVIDEDGLLHEALIQPPSWLLPGYDTSKPQPMRYAFGAALSERFQLCVAEALEQQQSHFTYSVDTPNGRKTFEARARIIDTLIRSRRAVLIVARDITTHFLAEAELRIAATAFESQHNAGLVITDATHRILRVNQAFSRMTGYCREHTIHKKAFDFYHDQQNSDFDHIVNEALTNQGNWEGEVFHRHYNGNVFPAWISISAVSDTANKLTHYIHHIQDLTQTKATEAELRSLALFDQLTSLPNRKQLAERLQKKSQHDDPEKHFGALLFIDLDDFKNINDLYSHQIGDLLLQQIGQRLRVLVEPNHLAARFGADEFVILLDRLPADETAARALTVGLCRTVLDSIACPVVLEGQFRQITACIGVTMFESRSLQLDELLLQADLAMHEAKQQGKGRMYFFDPSMLRQVTARLKLEDSIRLGIQSHEFTLHYQPQVDQQGQLAGAEALARWYHPERGMVSPGEFIPAAEAAGLMPELGKALLRKVCQQIAIWQQDPLLANVPIAINLSSAQIFDHDFVDNLLTTAAETGAPCNRLILEITESLLLRDLDDAQKILQRLRSYGVKFSIDDFGTGYSSLAYLQRLSLNELKIDRSFVTDLPRNASNLAIVRMILALAESLNLEVVAEGVETIEEWEVLRREGCTHAQGFYFAKPLPASDFEAWAHARQTQPLTTAHH